MINSIIHKATRKPGTPYNVLTCVTHSPYECNLAKSNAIFYGYQDQNVLPWNDCRPIPDNYILLERGKGDASLPKGVNFDFCLMQNWEAHFPYMKKYSQMFQIPLLNLVHVLPPPQAGPQYPAHVKRTYKSDLDIFISEFNRDAWGYSEQEARVIYHAADLDNFRPLPDIPKKPYILTVANLYRSRDWALGYRLYEQITQNLPRMHVGASEDKQWSQPIQDPVLLNAKMNESQVFLNTSLHSPIPCSLIEAASAGCAIVSTATTIIPEVFTHKKDAYLFSPDDPAMGRKHLEFLLQNPEECARIGAEARKTVAKFFDPNRFVSDWNNIFDEASRIPYTGK